MPREVAGWDRARAAWSALALEAAAYAAFLSILRTSVRVGLSVGGLLWLCGGIVAVTAVVAEGRANPGCRRHAAALIAIFLFALAALLLIAPLFDYLQGPGDG